MMTLTAHNFLKLLCEDNFMLKLLLDLCALQMIQEVSISIFCQNMQAETSKALKKQTT